VVKTIITAEVAVIENWIADKIFHLISIFRREVSGRSLYYFLLFSCEQCTRASLLFYFLCYLYRAAYHYGILHQTLR
jgi:hypothetical protein